jgi:hypothetical protein
MTTPGSSPISLTVSFRGTPHVLSLLPDTTLAALHSRLEELTEVPPHLQKLLYKGKKTPGESNAGEMTLVQAGLKDGTKVQMLGSTTKDLDGMKTVENENQRKERIMRERALKAPVKVCFSRFSLAHIVCLLSLSRTGAIHGSWSNILCLLVFVSCATIPLPRFERVTSPPQSCRSFSSLAKAI